MKKDVSGILILLATLGLIYINWNLVYQMKIDRKERVRPYIALYPGKENESYFFKLSNIGDRPAYDIEITRGGCEEPEISIKRLWQKENVVKFIGHESRFLRDEAKFFKVYIKYKDLLGNSYTDTVDVSLKVITLTKEEALLGAAKRITEKLDLISGILRKGTE